MTVSEILEELEPLGKESYKKVLLKHGIEEPCFGVKIEELKKIQKRIKKDYQLALDLYDTGIYDAMYLAGLIADDAKMTKRDLQNWVENSSCSTISECTVAWVAAESPHGRELAPKWIESDKEGKPYPTRYWATAEDYETDERRITVLPPPKIEELYCDQQHPAYLYYRPGKEDGSDLRGVKQLMEPLDFSSTTGNVTRVTQVPGGSDLQLRVKINKALKPKSSEIDAVQIVTTAGSAVKTDELRWWNSYKITEDALDSLKKENIPDKLYSKLKDLRKQEQDREYDAGQLTEEITGALNGVKDLSDEDREKYQNLVLQHTGHKGFFRIGFKNIRDKIDFTMVFHDKDGVKGSRKVMIEPVIDTGPVLQGLEPDVVRKLKTARTYMISAGARVPFTGLIRDDLGLARVRYAWTLQPEKFGSEAEQGNRVNIFGINVKLPEEAESPVNLAEAQYRSITAFGELLGKEESEPARKMAAWLKQKKPYGFRDPLTKRFPLKPDDWIKPTNADQTDDPLKWKYPRADEVELSSDFPVWDLEWNKKKIRAASNRTQPHYRLTLWLEAEDTDLDSETLDDGKTPRRHLGMSDRFTFRIVSDAVLLSEIATEENNIAKRFKEMYNTLETREVKLAEVVSTLDRGAIKSGDMKDIEGALNGMLGNLKTTTDAVDKGKDVAIGVRTDYQRIQKELRINQIQLTLGKVTNSIINPLMLAEQHEFPDARKALDEFSDAVNKARSMNNVVQISDSTRTSGKEAQFRIQQLKKRLKDVLDAMEKIEGINKLIEKLKEIEKTEKYESDLYKKIMEDIIREAFGEPAKP